MPSSEDQSSEFDVEADLRYLRTLIDEVENKFNDDKHAEEWKRALERIYDQLRGMIFYFYFLV